MMKRDVYDPAQQSYRVDFAAHVILRGGEATRRFDTCFEMGDCAEVMARLYARATRNPALFQRLGRYVSLGNARSAYMSLIIPKLREQQKRNTCEGCADCLIPGVRHDAHPSCTLPPLAEGEVVAERCDTCQKYPDDLSAARALYYEAREVPCKDTGSLHAVARDCYIYA